MTDVYVGSDGTAPSDGELILGVRGGDLDAYGALFQRHADAARMVARQYVPAMSDVDDVVAEAFRRVLDQLRKGAGPDQHFRAYLFTIVRRVSADLAERGRRTRPTGDDYAFEVALGTADSPERPTLEGFEHSTVTRAYHGLPERWQAVLWYTEIEGLSPAEVAPILGLTPNGVAALAYRARDGLRAGYLQEHLTAEPSDPCRLVNPLLGRYVRGGLSRRETAKVDEHLRTCDECRILVLELRDIAQTMRSAIGPLVLGVAGMAVLGALPLGVVTGGLSGAAALGAVGGTGTTAGTTGAAAGATGATAGATGATGATAGAGAAAGATTAGAGAAGVGAATAGATGAAVATAGAGISGAAVAAATGAVAVATVGVVSVLGAMSAEGPRADDLSPEVVAVAPDERRDPQPEPEPEHPVPTVSPTDIPDELSATEVAESSVVVVEVLETGAALNPRVVEELTFVVTNPGRDVAVDAHVQVVLPAGMRYAATSSPAGAAVHPWQPTTESLRCTPTGDAQTVLCRLGILAPASSTTVVVPVTVRAGGTYDVAVTAWADGAEPHVVDVPPTTVEMFGPELTTRITDVRLATNPGRVWVPFDVSNTGDVSIDEWSVAIRVPSGLTWHTVSGDLKCDAAADGQAQDGSTTLQCTGAALAAGATVPAMLRLLADGQSPAQTYGLQLLPALPASAPVVAATGTVEVPYGWRGANAGLRDLRAECRVRGGIAVADAVVVGTYRNLTDHTVRLALEANGSRATTSRTVEPGGEVTLTVSDGIRIPSGRATWTLTTQIGDSVHSRTVDAGRHDRAECYDPDWTVSTSARVVNDGGALRVEGTITNRSDESMQVRMTAVGDRSEAVRLSPGETKNLSVPTTRTSLDAGQVAFLLTRWAVDHDGDLPSTGVMPAKTPTAGYAAAVLAPRATVTDNAGACRYDAATETSSKPWKVTLDNTASTLPVVFVVDGTERQVRAGASSDVTLTVSWGTEKIVVRADGNRLTALDVTFPSCAEPPAWPEALEAAASAQCVDGSVQAAVDVVNGDGRSWRVAVPGAPSGVAPRDVAPDTSARLVVAEADRRLRPAEVEVQIARSIEGVEHTLTRVVRHEGARCRTVAPEAYLDLGDVQVDTYHDRWLTSWRTAALVLDNSASNVAVTFTVTDDAGQRSKHRVPAGEQHRIGERRVDGRLGVSATVRAGGSTTTHEVERFSGAATGWCAEQVSWGERYARGDQRSWQGYTMEYVGPGNGKGNGKGAEKDQVWSGQWKHWQEVGLCEYR